MPAPLLSRAADPVLGVVTGLLAFYLHEHNPRTAPQESQDLLSLASWKMDKWRNERARKHAREELAAQQA